MLSFHDLGVFKGFRSQNPEAEGKMSYEHVPEKKPVLRRMSVTPLGFCFRVFVTEKPLNLKKTIYSV